MQQPSQTVHSYLKTHLKLPYFWERTQDCLAYLQSSVRLPFEGLYSAVTISATAVCKTTTNHNIEYRGYMHMEVKFV